LEAVDAANGPEWLGRRKTPMLPMGRWSTGNRGKKKASLHRKSQAEGMFFSKGKRGLEQSWEGFSTWGLRCSEKGKNPHAVANSIWKRRLAKREIRGRNEAVVTLLEQNRNNSQVENVNTEGLKGT